MKQLTIVLFILLGASSLTNAQGQVQVTMTIPNLGSAYLSDYISSETNRVLIITNTTAQTQEIFLRGKIEQLSSPGYYFRTKEEYRPTTALALNAFETKTLFAHAEDWAFIEERQLEDNIPAEEEERIKRTGILPEGEYQICVQAFDIHTGLPLSSDEPAGCQFFIITLGTPPQILLPISGDTIEQEYPMISWSPAILMQSAHDLRYDLYVVELTNRALNPFEVMEQSILYRGGNPFVAEDLQQTFYQLLPGDPRFEKNGRYVMCVIARTSRGTAQFENEGRSEIAIVDVRGDTPALFDYESIEVTQANPGDFQLYQMSSLQGKLLYRFYEDKNIPIDGQADILAYDIDNDNMSFGMEPIQSVDHTISGNDGAVEQHMGNGSIALNGNINENVSLQSVNDVFQTSLPPQFILPAGYNIIGSHALMNARIRFTARYAVGKKALVKHPEDLILITGLGAQMQATGPLIPEPLSVPASSKVIAATTTDEEGNYSVSFFADESFGVIATGAVQVECGSGDIPQTISGQGLYRVITMEVEEKWYCHPDIIILLQPGQSLDVPDQAVTVQSYNMELKIMGTTDLNQMAKDGPIDNAVVKVGRRKDYYDQAPLSFPRNEVKIEEFKPALFRFDEYMVADSGLTGAQGTMKFTRMVKHDGGAGCSEIYSNQWPNDGYYIEAYSHPLIGDLNYGWNSISSFTPCATRLPYTCAANECAPRSAAYVPPLVLDTIRLAPNLPGIVANTKSVVDGFTSALPNVTMLLMVVHHEGGLALRSYKSDANGLFSKQFTYPSDFPDLMYYYSTGEKAGTIPYDYAMAYHKPGYKLNQCTNCGLTTPQKLSFGQRWIMEPLFDPDSYVQGKVIDEHGQAIHGQIRIGDGPELTFGPQMIGGQFQAELVVQQQGGNPQENKNKDKGQNLNLSEEEVITDPGVMYMGGMNVQYEINEAFISDYESRFSQQAPSGKMIPLIIDPLADNYLADTFLVDIPEGYKAPGFDLGTFKIMEALHRPRITVYYKTLAFGGDEQLDVVHTPIEGAQVTLSDFPLKVTPANGSVLFTPFGSPSKEFHLKVFKDGYVPVDTFITIPVSKDVYDIEIFLKDGKTITGTVTRANDGQPINEARIYAEIGSNIYGPILVETFSDANGHYALSNLPSESIVVKAAKSDPTITYVGQSKTVNPGQVIIVNFQLTEAPFSLPEVWNLPVEVESVAAFGSKWKVKGAFVSIPSNARFEPEESDLRLPFENVVVKVKDASGPNGKPVVEPEESAIETNTLKFRSILNESSMILMSGPPGHGSGVMHYYNNSFTPVWLHKVRVDKENGNGHVRVRAFSLLEYFRFSYDYTGQFYLGETPNSITISAFKGSAENSMPESYYLMGYSSATQQVVNPSFRVHEFDAFADRNESYVHEDSFVVATKLVVDLPQSNPDKIIVSTGDVIILHDNVIVNEGDQPIEFDLETWHVKTGNWHFDNNQGGIVTSAVITTGLLEFEAPQILIHPEKLILPPADQIDLDKITLGGVVDMGIDQSNAKLKFDYVEKPQHSSTGHWRIQLAHEQQGQPVAVISGLPGWGASEIGILFIEHFSDGYENMIMPPGQVVNHYNVMNQVVTDIIGLVDGVKFTGNVDLGIPNMETGHTVGFIYSKEQEEIIMNIQGFATDFETTGQVEFTGDQEADRIILYDHHFEVTGSVLIYDDLSSNVISLRAKLIKDHNDIRIKIIQVDQTGELEGDIAQTISLGGGQAGVKRILQGEQEVSQQQWQSLVYQARFEGFGGGFQSGHDVMWFKVDGAIVNDESSDDQVKLTDIETPFGDFSLTLDFNEMAIVGDLRVGNIPMGAVTILEGVINMKMGGLGFYLAAHLRAVYPLIAELNTNFIVGSYPHLDAEVQQVLKTGMYIQQLPGFLTQSGIQGLYISANKPLIELDWEIDLVVFGIGVYANAGVDARFWLNFGDSYGGAYLGGLAYADFEVYANVLVCELCVGVMAELGFQAEYQWEPDTDFSISVCGTIGFNLSFCDLADFDETAKVELGWSSASSDISFDVELGSSCSGNANQSDGGCKHF